MAYNVLLQERVQRIFDMMDIQTEGKKFFGGYCFFMDDKMCIGMDIDKKTGQDRLMARIGDESMEMALKRPGCRPMDMTGRPMKGYVFIDPAGFENEHDLAYWVQLGIDFNPFAKRSKRKKK
jgi:hypothetical protein